MEKFGRSQPVKRVEDRRFVTGQGRYIDDTAPVGAAHAVFVRSPVAHGVLRGVDVEAARGADGVLAVLTAEELRADGVVLDMEADLLDLPGGGTGADVPRPILAHAKLRFVGEPVAVVLAESRQAGRDAAELVEIDYEDLPPHLALEPGGEAIHDAAPDNVALRWHKGDKAAVEAAMAEAAHIVETRIEDNRVIVNAIEPRGAWAEWDGARLHLSVNGQGVWELKSKLARHLGLDREAVRITNPDVGGGFGMKGQTYPEHYVIAAAARKLGRPVRWMSERTEGMLTDNAGRDLVSVTRLAFDETHRITAYAVETVSNLGAYNSEYGQWIQTDLFAKVLMGTYDVQTTWLDVTCVYTNTTQVDAYRGAGRPEAIFVLERSMDNAARALGVDPFELRRKNFIPADKFPYTSATGMVYDVGDFHKVLARGEAEADVAGFAARLTATEGEGKVRGLGLCYYIESILGSMAESVEVAFNEDGTASIFVGTQSNGQGHETVFASFLSDQTGIPFEKISVVQGDSDLIPRGGGTGGSRSVTVQTNVTLVAVAAIIGDFSAFLAEKLGVDPEAVSFDDETFRIEGSNATPTMLEVAEMAREAGREDLLSFKKRARIDGRSFPNGAHIAEVVIDPATGVVAVDRYTVVDDFGNLINPMLAEGQVHGGVAQGIGQAITEQVVFDDAGQLLTASFMDYAMPRAEDLPMIGFTSEPVPSTANPMGMKGCGEAGTVGALAAVSNAVHDALAPLGATDIQMPFTPHRVWRAIREAQAAVAAE
ncbi:MAG: xanthine dehydrogenase family protein molybdopterin-binding subunit [Paracoccaceae bacterium]|nr:xanthine dehydrogenase family protein molybdopterin-binding subunit [Paracoccaceae bacterium]